MSRLRTIGGAGGGAAPAGDTDFFAPMGTDDAAYPNLVTILNGEQSLGAEDVSGANTLTDTIVVSLGTSDEVISALDAVDEFVASLGGDAQAALADLTVTITTSLGTDTQAGFNVPSEILFVVSLGIENASLAADLAATLTATLGTEAHSSAATLTEEGTAATGTDSASHTASTNIVGSGLPNAAAQSAADWTNINNIKTESDATLATVTAAASPTSGDTYIDVLTADQFLIIGGHSGWTRTLVELQVRQDWDSTIGALSALDHIITARKEDGTGEFTIDTKTEADPSRDALATDTFDITSNVSGWSDAELAAINVRFDAFCNLVIVSGGNADWRIAWAKIRVTLDRTGMS